MEEKVRVKAKQWKDTEEQALVLVSHRRQSGTERLRLYRLET